MERLPEIGPMAIHRH